MTKKLQVLTPDVIESFVAEVSQFVSTDLVLKRSGTLRETLADPEQRKRASEKQKKSWQTPERRAAQHEAIARRRERGDTFFNTPHSDETKAKIGKASAENWKDPEYKRAMSKAISDGYTPEAKAKARATRIEKWKDPAFKEMMTEKIREASAKKVKERLERTDTFFLPRVNDFVYHEKRGRAINSRATADKLGCGAPDLAFWISHRPQYAVCST